MSFAVTPYGYEKQAVGQLIAALGRGARATAATAAGAKDFVKNTYNPGFSQLRQQLRTGHRVSRLYPPGSPAAVRAEQRMPIRRDWDAGRQQRANEIAAAEFQPSTGSMRNAGGFYSQNVAAVHPSVTDPQWIRKIMRHELGHAIQHRRPVQNSFQGLINRLNDPEKSFEAIAILNKLNPGTSVSNFIKTERARWRSQLGHYLAEIHSEAVAKRGFGRQTLNALRYVLDPNFFHAKLYGDPWRYLALKVPTYSGFAYGGNALYKYLMDLYSRLTSSNNK